MQTPIPPLDDSPLALSPHRVGDGESLSIGDAGLDSLLYIAVGSGSFALDGVAADLGPGTAALVLAGEQATITATSALELIEVTVGPVEDVHAALGPRETVVAVDPGRTERAFGTRAFQLLFGPHNGSIRATLFAGFIPPGRSPWHYHLYDEIVWIPEGPGRLHRPDADEPEPLESGSAFRLRPRHVHIVENASEDGDMTIVGFFTPAGTPSAAYLADVADAGSIAQVIT
jgi:mannose-6-phosphate isomerase-like protein (cupin superfamily)